MTNNEKIIKFLNEENARLEHELQDTKEVTIALFLNLCGLVGMVDNVHMTNVIGGLLYPDENNTLHKKPMADWSDEQKEDVGDLLKKLTLIMRSETTPSTKDMFGYFVELELPKRLH